MAASIALVASAAVSLARAGANGNSVRGPIKWQWVSQEKDGN
jgi:hypothetical protein